MARKYTGKIVTYRVEKKRENGDIYIYEQDRQYDPEKKYAVILRSKLLGVKRKGTNKVVSTRARRKFVNVTQTEVSPLGDVTAVRKHVGMIDIIDHISETSFVDEDVRASTDLPTANKILSMARYIVCSDSDSLAGIEEWQYTHKLPYGFGISKNVYHTLFKEIGRDETLQQTFFKFRLDREDEVGLYLACDSTLISTYSDNLTNDIARYGFDKNKDGLPKVKFLVLFSLKNQMPVWFTELPGNINDVVTIKLVLDELKALGVKNVTVVTDNGYCSDENIGEMLAQGYDFITLVKTDLKWVKPEIDKYYKTVQNIVYACQSDLDTHGITSPVVRELDETRGLVSKEENLKDGDKNTKQRTVYIHIFFNPERKIAQDNAVKAIIFEAKKQLESGIEPAALSENVRKLVFSCCSVSCKYGSIVKVTPRQDDFEQYCKYNGIFTIVSSKELDCSDCLQWYRCREKIEGFFRRAKGDVSMERTGVWDKDILRGRMFIQFVALCLYQHTENEIMRVKNSLLEDTYADGKTKPAKLRKDEKKLLNFLNSRSIVRILNWFDAYDTVDVSITLKQKRWSEPMISYEQIFLERLGVIPMKTEKQYK